MKLADFLRAKFLGDPECFSTRYISRDGLRGWAYRIRTDESVRELPDWICVTTWPEVGACAESRPQTPVRRSRGGAGLSLALPMAIPICGVASAAASLTPSPTTANPSVGLQPLDDLGLIAGQRTSAMTRSMPSCRATELAVRSLSPVRRSTTSMPSKLLIKAIANCLMACMM
jgi:hypothetical protein